MCKMKDCITFLVTFQDLSISLHVHFLINFLVGCQPSSGRRSGWWPKDRLRRDSRPELELLRKNTFSWKSVASPMSLVQQGISTWYDDKCNTVFRSQANSNPKIFTVGYFLTWITWINHEKRLPAISFLGSHECLMYSCLTAIRSKQARLVNT